MTKTDICSALTDFVGRPFITRSELAKALGYSDIHYVSDILQGLPVYKTRFLIKDIAERMKENERIY